MTTALENQLRQVFAEDASQAPDPGPVTHRVRQQARRGRRGVVTLAAAAAVVVAVAVPAVLLGGGESTGPAPTPGPSGCLVRAALYDGSGRVGVTARDDCSFIRVAGRGNFHWPELSPDGTRLAYVEVADRSRSKLLVTDLETGATEVLLDGLPTPRNPVWSPDGQRIAFEADNPDFNAEDPQRGGSPVINVYEFATKSATTVSVGQVGRGSPQWSPDGRSLLVTESGEQGALVRVDLETGTETTLPRYWIAAWSADGSQVIGVDNGSAGIADSTATPETTQLVVFDATTGEEIRRSEPFPAPHTALLDNNDIAWDADGIVAILDSTAITFDDNLDETGRTTLPTPGRLGFDFRNRPDTAGDANQFAPAETGEVAAWSSPLPGGEKVTRLDDGATDAMTGPAEIDLGAPPAAATHLEVHLTCLTAGRIEWPDGSSMTCGPEDAGSPSFTLIPINPDSTTYRFIAGPEDRWRFEIFYVLREITDWATNESGETYGVQNQRGTPDLVAVVATNGQQGYARRADLNDPRPKTPGEALEYQRTRGPATPIPVYKSDGETVIGEFVTSDGDVTTSP